MESTRQQKFARLIQRDMSEIFQRESTFLFDRVMITVTTVRVSPDLGVAKIYLSLLLSNDNGATLEKIKDATSKLRNLLGKKIKNQVKKVPEIYFYLDDSADYASKMDNLISGLDIPEENKEDQ
ncbi:MAG: 30S ribosome-binding factor RbfA [Cyclobacteriaceae bacterium]